MARFGLGNRFPNTALKIGNKTATLVFTPSASANFLAQGETGPIQIKVTADGLFSYSYSGHTRSRVRRPRVPVTWVLDREKRDRYWHRRWVRSRRDASIACGKGATAIWSSTGVQLTKPRGGPAWSSPRRAHLERV